jgi:hypothetical protein
MLYERFCRKKPEEIQELSAFLRLFRLNNVKTTSNSQKQYSRNKKFHP